METWDETVVWIDDLIIQLKLDFARCLSSMDKVPSFARVWRHDRDNAISARKLFYSRH